MVIVNPEESLSIDTPALFVVVIINELDGAKLLAFLTPGILTITLPADVDEEAEDDDDDYYYYNYRCP